MDQGREIRQSEARVNGRRRRRKKRGRDDETRAQGFFHLATGAIAAANYPHSAFALDYPRRPITIVVPFAAGGATDVLARVLADVMGKSLGQTMIVENVTG